MGKELTGMALCLYSRIARSEGGYSIASLLFYDRLVDALVWSEVALSPTTAVFDIMRDQLHTIFWLMPSIIQGEKPAVLPKDRYPQL